MYAALMIDLKDSRAYDQARRQAIQEFIHGLCPVLNEIFTPGLVHPVSIAGGDEVQGLFSRPEGAYLYYRLFALLMGEVELRAGIGLGDWDVKLAGENSAHQDGSAYHRARDAVSAAKEDPGYTVLLCSGGRRDSVLNSLLGTCAAQTRDMSASQRQTLLLTELFSPLTVPGQMAEEGTAKLFELLRLRSSLLGTPEGTREVPGAPLTGAVTAVDALAGREKLYNTGGRVRGVPSRIAACLDISRQSVERTLKNAGIYSIRALSVSALRYMADMDRETTKGECGI